MRPLIPVALLSLERKRLFATMLCRTRNKAEYSLQPHQSENLQLSLTSRKLYNYFTPKRERGK